MSYSQAQNKASQKYNKNHIKRIPLDVQLGKYEEIKSVADSLGLPVNTFIKRCIDNEIKRLQEC